MNEFQKTIRNHCCKVSFLTVFFLTLFWLMTVPIAHANQSANTTPASPPLAGFIGVAIGKLPNPLRAHMPDNVAKTQGLYVAWMADTSPAADDGIKLYDVLLSYDGQPIGTPDTFIEKVRQDKPGRIVNIKLVRQGKILTLPVTLGQQIKRTTPLAATTAAAVRNMQRPPQYNPNIPTTNPNVARSNPYPSGDPRMVAVNPNSQNNMRPPVQQPVPLNITGKPAYPMRKKPKKEAWGDERNIWSDFYTDFTGDFWDEMINAPFNVGRMPGGWRAPSWSSPDPVTIGDAVLNQVPPIMEEAGNMTDFTD